MAKMLQKVESTDAGVKEMRGDTIQNPKKDGHCMAITTRSGKVVSNQNPSSTKDEQDEEQVDTERMKVHLKRVWKRVSTE